MSISTEICRLREQHATGMLDDREFARAKHALLSRQAAERQRRRRQASPGRVLRGLRRVALTAGG